MTGRLFVICGLPGSGKTTLAKQLEATHDAIRYCPDEVISDPWDQNERARIEGEMWSQAQHRLAAGMNVIIEFGSWGRAERDELREGARRIGAAVELRYLDAPIDELARRVEARDDTIGITRAHLEEWQHLIDVPDQAEFDLFD